MRPPILASVGLIALSFLGCAAQTPFTHGMRNKYSLTDQQLQQLQYYVSEKVVLQREMQEDEVSVTGTHKMRVFQGRRVEEIILRPGTPGVCDFVDSYRLGISFEEEDHLVFGSPIETRDELGGKYFILANEWTNGRGRVKYEEREYWTSIGSANAHLLIDLEQLRKFERESRTLPGRRLQN